MLQFSQPARKVFPRPPLAFLASPRPLVSFGFGGKLVVMFPRKPRRFSQVQRAQLHDVDLNTTERTQMPTPEGEDTLRPGKIQSLLLHKQLADTPYVQGLKDFPGPLVGKGSSATRLPSFFERNISTGNAGSDLLWAFLKLYQEHLGTVARTQRQAGAKNKAKDILDAKSQTLEQEMIPYLLKDTAQVGPFSGPPAEDPAYQMVQAPVATPPDVSNVEAGVEVLLEKGRQAQALTDVQICLLKGEREEAIRLCVEAHLWTHALLLASSNQGACQQVIAAFATQTCTEGSPLQTMYLLSATQHGHIFKSIPDRPQTNTDLSSAVPILRNWRSNLAMMLANPCASDSRVMIHLGDVLWSKYGQVEAAHVCYLMAGCQLESSFAPKTRLVLLGADHRRNPCRYVTPLAVQRTEVIELARTLKNSQFTMPDFQVFKFLYASMLAEVGMIHKAAKYVHTVQQIVKKTAAKHAKSSSGFHYPPAFLVELPLLQARIRRLQGPLADGGGGGITKIFRGAFSWISRSDSVTETTSGKSSTKSDGGTQPKSTPGTTAPKKGQEPGVLGRMFGWKGGVKPGDREAHLEEENEMYFCETRKKWLTKGHEDSESEEDDAPPPPTLGTVARNALGAKTSSGVPGAASLSGANVFTAAQKTTATARYALNAPWGTASTRLSQASMPQAIMPAEEDLSHGPPGGPRPDQPKAAVAQAGQHSAGVSVLPAPVAGPRLFVPRPVSGGASKFLVSAVQPPPAPLASPQPLNLSTTQTEQEGEETFEEQREWDNSGV